MEKPQWTKIDKRLMQELTVKGAPPMQLVARATGWQIAGQAIPAAFTGALVNVAPEAILVQHEDREERVPIGNPDRMALFGMLGAALLVSAVCWLITGIATRLIAPRKR